MRGCDAMTPNFGKQVFDTKVKRQRSISRLAWLHILPFAGLIIALLILPASAQTEDFSYVQIWTGEPDGAKKAVVAIDWSDGASCVVWGYRWNDGLIDGRTMIEAMKTEQTRLFERETGGSGFPDTIYGLGYDQDGDGFPGINEQDGEASTPIDTDDRYREGWFTAGYWHIGQSIYSAGRVWDEHAKVTNALIDDGGAFGARYCPDFRCEDLPVPANCIAVSPANTPTPTATVNATATNTPTFSPTATATVTATATNTLSPTSTPTARASATAPNMPSPTTTATIPQATPSTQPASPTPTTSIPEATSTPTSIITPTEIPATSTATPLPNGNPVVHIPDDQQTYEDTPLIFSPATGNNISMSDDAGANPIICTLTVTNGTLTLGNTAGLTFDVGDGIDDVSMTLNAPISAINQALNGLTFFPDTNFYGSAMLTVSINDLGHTGSDDTRSIRSTLAIAVVSVNDSPSFVGGGNLTLENSAKPQRITNWATHIAPGPNNEATQQVTFDLTGYDTMLFAEPPTIDADGTLTCVPSVEHTGTTTMTIVLRDDGGTDYGGSDQSQPYMCTVRIIPDAPTTIDLLSFTAMRDQGEVDLHWETGMEIETWGFHVLRSADDRLSNAIRVTDALILARGDGTNSTRYTWRDKTANDGMVWTYWLEEVEFDGTTNKYGPFSLTQWLQDDSGTHRLFLPLVVR